MLRISIPSVTFSAFSEIARKARVAKSRLMNRTEPLERAKDYMVQRWDVNFDGQGAIYGDWPELADWTVESRGGSSSPILVRTGALWAHFVEQNEDGKVSPSAVDWNFSNQDGAWTVSHHDGYPNPIRGRRSIPARKLWDFNAEDEDEIKEMFEVWVDREINSIFG